MKTNKPGDLGVPPNDLEAERSVIGAILVDDSAYVKIADLISPDSFYSPKHGIIYRAIVDLFYRNEPTDFVMVSAELKARGELENIGGDYYLAELQETVPFPRNVVSYARLVDNKYLLRNISQMGNRCLSEAQAHDADSAHIVSGLIDQLMGFQAGKTNGSGVYQTAQAVVAETIEELDAISKRGDETTGVPTGFADIDYMLGGYQKGDLIVIAARPSMGKTALMLGSAYHAARKGVPVGIVSFEMSNRKIMCRLLSFVTKIDLRRITHARMTDQEWEKIAKAQGTISELPIYLVDPQRKHDFSIFDIRAQAKLWKLQHNMGLLCIDHIGLIHHPDLIKHTPQTIGLFTRQLKTLAIEIDIPILALAQLSRAVESRGGDFRPILSDLRDSGKIEEDADVVLFIFRPDRYCRTSADHERWAKAEGKSAYEIERYAEVEVAKQRNGPIGTTMHTFEKTNAMFSGIRTTQIEYSPERTPQQEIDNTVLDGNMPDPDTPF